MVKIAFSDASTRSQASARLKPKPPAGPLTAAITGFSMRAMVAITPCTDTVSFFRNGPAEPTISASAFIAFRLPPAQKALPLPVIITARTEASSSQSISASSSASTSGPSIAL